MASPLVSKRLHMLPSKGVEVGDICRCVRVLSSTFTNFNKQPLLSGILSLFLFPSTPLNLYIFPTFLWSSCFSYFLLVFQMHVPHSILLFPHYPLLPMTRFSFPVPQWSSNSSSYQSTTANTSDFLSETLLLSISKITLPRAVIWPLWWKSSQAPFQSSTLLCMCPKTQEKLSQSPFTLYLSHNCMTHGFNHWVHVIILKSKSWAFTSCLSPSHLISTAQGTLLPRYNSTWKSTHIKIQFPLQMGYLFLPYFYPGNKQFSSYTVMKTQSNCWPIPVHFSYSHDLYLPTPQLQTPLVSCARCLMDSR